MTALLWLAMMVAQMTPSDVCVHRFTWKWYASVLDMGGPDKQNDWADISGDDRADLRDVQMFQNLFDGTRITVVR